MDRHKRTLLAEVASFMGVACLIVSLGGCMYNSSPTDNAGFSPIETIRDIEGVYRNLGEGGRPHWDRVYLSEKIWPGSGTQHTQIGYIEVRVVDGNALQVRAFRDDGAVGVVKEETFIEGRDFEIRSGRIRLKSEGFTFKRGNPLLGLSYDKKELGLDEKGHGKYRELSAGAGLYYALVLMVGGSDEEVRFVRAAK